MTATYRKRALTVEAVQIAADTDHPSLVPSWLDGVTRAWLAPLDQPIGYMKAVQGKAVLTPEGWRVPNVGDWLTVNKDGASRVYSPEAFAETFAPTPAR